MPGLISGSIVAASCVSMKYPCELSYWMKQPGYRQLYRGVSADSLWNFGSISV